MLNFSRLFTSVVRACTALGLSGIAISSPSIMLTGMATIAVASPAQAVNCGSFNGKVCAGTAFQYGGGFSPNAGEFGGFGGASNCSASRTPVIFVHGNADNSTSWDAPTFQVAGYPKPPNSVYQQFKAAGYKDCELFGVTYLSDSERGAEQLNYHQPSKYEILAKFVNAVKKYTGKSKVDLITHSMGVSMSMATFTYYGSWGNVRRFINVAGGLHGLDSCLWTGYGNPLASTCGSQNWLNPNVFGFYPNYSGLNAWTGTSASYALANSGVQNPSVNFYTLYAGTKDQFMCATVSNYATCGNSPLLTAAPNVKAQINVGAGADTQQLNWDWTTGSPFNVNGGDQTGVGHFHAKTNTGTIMVKMLTTTCTTGCAADYVYGPTK